MSQALEVKVCSYCGDEIDEDEGYIDEDPNDGSPVCQDCYTEHFMDTCALCEEYFEKPEASGKPEFFIVGRSSLDERNIDSKHLPPGLYQITGYPHFISGIIEMYLYYDRWQRIGDLFRADPLEFDGYPIGTVCPGCVDKRQAKAETVAQTGVEQMSVRQWRNLVAFQPVAARDKAFRCPQCGTVQSASTIAMILKMDLARAEAVAFCECHACGLSLEGVPGDEALLAKPHKVAVDTGSGKLLPAFAPITPEGAVLFMTGGIAPQCRECGNTRVFRDNVWVAPDLCQDCQQYLERKQRVCRGCGRTGEQMPFGGLTTSWREPDLCSECSCKKIGEPS